MNRRKRTRYLIRRLIRTTLARVRETKRKEKTCKQSTSPRSPRANATPPGGRRGGSRAHRHAAAGRCRCAAERTGAAASAGANATAARRPRRTLGTADAGAAPNVNPVDASDATGDSRPERRSSLHPVLSGGRPERERRRSRRALGFGGASFGSRAELELVFPPRVAQRRAQQGVVVLFPPFLLFERRIDPAPSARLGGAAAADPNQNAGGATTAPVSSHVFAAAPFAAATPASVASGGRSKSSARTIFGSVAAARSRPRKRGVAPGDLNAPILPFEPRTTSLTRPLVVVNDETFGDGDEAANAASSKRSFRERCADVVRRRHATV